MSDSDSQSFLHLEPPGNTLAEVNLRGGELLAIIRDAVSTVPELPKNADNSLVDGQPCSPESLLTLLVYAYAQAIYGSWQIEETILKGSSLLLASDACLPDHQLLTQFRRKHRAAIQSCLRKVYWFIWVKYGVQNREFQLVVDGARGKRVRVSPRFSGKIEDEVSNNISHAVFVDQMMAD